MFPNKRDGDSWNNLNNDIQVKMRGKLKKGKRKKEGEKKEIILLCLMYNTVNRGIMIIVLCFL